MSGMVDKASVQKQYATADNLAIRIAFQQRFSANKQGFAPWLMDQYVFPEKARVLEIGCGTGTMWKTRPEAAAGFSRLVLTDLSEGMLREAQENVTTCLARVGAEENRYEMLMDRYSIDELNYTEIKSGVEEIDAAETIMFWKMAEAVYNQSLAVGAKVIQPTLLDFLR